MRRLERLEALEVRGSRDAVQHAVQLSVVVSQLPDSCGYNSAAWACLLRSLGFEFHSLTMDAAAAAVDDPEFIRAQNALLGLESWGTRAKQLTGDESVNLISQHNPDGITTGASWLSGPAPVNFWRTHFERTLANVAEHGTVHIMVVNTESAIHLTDELRGTHWFVAAWRVYEDIEDAGGV